MKNFLRQDGARAAWSSVGRARRSYTLQFVTRRSASICGRSNDAKRPLTIAVTLRCERLGASLEGRRPGSRREKGERQQRGRSSFEPAKTRHLRMTDQERAAMTQSSRQSHARGIGPSSVASVCPLIRRGAIRFRRARSG